MSAIDPSVSLSDQRIARKPRGLNALILGSDNAMRINIQRTLMSFAIYMVWQIAEAICAMRGLVSWPTVWVLYAFNCFGLFMCYGMIRSGFSIRFKDPSMVLAQSVYAMVALMLPYVAIPQLRSADLQTLCVTLVFGMFTLKPRELIVCCAWAIGLLLCTLALILWLHLPNFDLKHEAINIAVACIVMPALTAIIRHFALLRQKLQTQRSELKSALARVQELATRDALTNLTNRAHMQEILNQEILRHQRHGAVFCLALIDLDHFKRINDRYGHQIGDEVLVGFARESTAIQRQSDVVARWGGEEFLLLLPQTPLDCALQAMERVRERVAQARLSSNVDDLQVTISAGIAQWKAGEPLTQVLERADKALYAAKRAGRNRCALAE